MPQGFRPINIIAPLVVVAAVLLVAQQQAARRPQTNVNRNIQSDDNISAYNDNSPAYNVPDTISNSNNANVPPSNVTLPTGDKDLVYYDGFESGAPGTGWTSHAISDAAKKSADFKALSAVTEQARRGRYALKVVVRPEDAVYPGDQRADKERAELLRLNSCRLTGVCSLGDEGAHGSEWWYSWSVFIPQGYDFKSEPHKFEIMGQWHDQADPGEDPTGYSPPMSVAYRSDGKVQGFLIKYGLRNFNQTIQEYLTPIDQGKWIDLVFHIRFSKNDDGFMEVWKDGIMLKTSSGSTKVTGPNMYNTVPNYLRLGIYRGFALSQTNTIYYDEVRIGRSRAAVWPQ